MDPITYRWIEFLARFALFVLSFIACMAYTYLVHLIGKKLRPQVNATLYKISAVPVIACTVSVYLGWYPKPVLTYVLDSNISALAYAFEVNHAPFMYMISMIETYTSVLVVSSALTLLSMWDFIAEEKGFFRTRFAIRTLIVLLLIDVYIYVVLRSNDYAPYLRTEVDAFKAMLLGDNAYMDKAMDSLIDMFNECMYLIDDLREIVQPICTTGDHLLTTLVLIVTCTLHNYADRLPRKIPGLKLILELLALTLIGALSVSILVMSNTARLTKKDGNLVDEEIEAMYMRRVQEEQVL